MPRDRFVRPDTVTLPLSEGDWILVKRRLNAGELRDAHSRMYINGVDGALTVNVHQVGIAMMLAYLVDWNLTQNGEPVPIRMVPLDELETILRRLEPESFGEIRKAIEAHEAREDAIRAEEKKTRDGLTTSAPTSGSPGAAAGASSGFASSIPTSTPSSATS